MIQSSRRSFLTGLASIIAVPAIVRVSSLMPIRGIIMNSVLMTRGVPVWADLCDVTRQAFVPRLFIQLYETDPFLSTLRFRGIPLYLDSPPK